MPALRTVARLVLLVVALFAAASCRDFAGSSTGPAGIDAAQLDASPRAGDAGASDADAGPPADAGIVEPIGSADRVDVATWNIENFPQDVATPDLVAQIILSLELDLVAVQEIADETVFERLLDRLDGYDYILSHHEYRDGSYQKLGFIYRADLLRVLDVDLLFNETRASCEEEGTFRDPFPRPPLEVTFEVGEPLASTSYRFTAIDVHLKAFEPPCSDDCRLRRACANRHLEAYVRDQVENPDLTDNVIVLGDFNDTLDNGAQDDPFQHWDSPRYEIRTDALDADDYSFVHTGALLDHAIVTAEMEPDFGGGAAQVVYLDRELDDYTDRVSDHLPVTMSFAPPPP